MRRGTHQQLLPLLLLIALAATWALSMPLGAAPDEASHVRQAGAVARGELGRVNAKGRLAAVRIPEYFNFEPCHSQGKAKDASCLQVPESSRPWRTEHSALGYPPLYYAIAGAPTLLLGGTAGLYAMRLGTLVAGALLIFTAASRVKWLPSPTPALIGYVAALTPMALFLMGTTNPSGLAIPAGIAAWGWGHHLVRVAPLNRLRLAATGTGVAMCTQLLVRRDSIIWVAATIALLALITPRRRWTGLLRSRSVHVLGGALVAATATLLWYSAGALGRIATPRETEHVQIDLAWARSQLAVIYREMIGILGWLDTEIPLFSQIIFGVVLAGLVGLALTRAPRAVAVAVGLIVIGSATAILVFDATRPAYVQGRYLLPFAAGAPVLAGLGLAEVGYRVRRDVAAAVLGLLAVAQFGAFWAALRRFAVGPDGPALFFSDTAWNPPLAPAGAMLALNAVVSAALVASLLRRQLGSGGPGHEGQSRPGAL